MRRGCILVVALLAGCEELVDVGLTRPTSSDAGAANGARDGTAGDPPDAGMNAVDAAPNPTMDAAVATCATDPLLCRYCNTDQECSDGEYCESNLASRTGDCTPCPQDNAPLCPNGTQRTLAYGNGCAETTCECPPWTSPDPLGGCEGPAPGSSWLELDPATMTFFGLPIDSLRYAVSGLDPNAHTCVTLIWDYSNNGMRPGAHCDDFFQGFPYVIITPNTGGPCGDWDYSTEVVTRAASGCVDFAELATPGVPGVDLVDVVVEVESPAFTGWISANNRASVQPRPVSFAFAYSTDVPSQALYVQERSESGDPGWIRVLLDGVAVGPGEPCDTPCPQQPTCTRGQATARNIIASGAFGGRIALTWDGWVWNTPTAATCAAREAAHPGDYEAEICYGRTTSSGTTGELVSGVTCQRVPFTYPAGEEVLLRIDEGG